MEWNDLNNMAQVGTLLEHSKKVPCAILKHSTRCNISTMAKYRLEDGWCFDKEEIEPYLLDLLSHRDISNHLSELFGVHHESPQILLIHEGVCIYDASHLDITVAELKEAL